MQIQTQMDNLTLVLSKDEQRLLRRALERALFIDTPPSEQGDIAAFCSRLLSTLPEEPIAQRVARR